MARGCEASHGSVRTCRQHGLLHMCTWRRVGDASCRVSVAALRRAPDAHAPRVREPRRLTCLNGRRVPDAPCSVTSRQSFELHLFSFRSTFVGATSCFLQVFPRFRKPWLTPMPMPSSLSFECQKPLPANIRLYQLQHN